MAPAAAVSICVVLSTWNAAGKRRWPSAILRCTKTCDHNQFTGFVNAGKALW